LLAAGNVRKIELEELKCKERIGTGSALLAK